MNDKSSFARLSKHRFGQSRSEVLMYTVIWEYDVPRENSAAFETMYGASGRWVALFRRAEGFIETALLRDVSVPGRYVTLDRWSSAAAYARFSDDNREEYDQLDADAASLTAAERRLGCFES